MMKQMTNQEKYNILHYRFDALWQNLWCETSLLIDEKYRIENNVLENEMTPVRFKKNEYYYSKDKFYKLHSNQEIIKLVEESNYYQSWKVAEWGFPKGRKNNNESNFSCAIREASEETGYPISSMIPTNYNSYSEIFRGSNNKTYKHVYYIMYINYENDDQFKLRKFDEGEVSDCQWKLYEECIQDIRHYNIEKKKVITDINHMINLHF